MKQLFKKIKDWVQSLCLRYARYFLITCILITYGFFSVIVVVSRSKSSLIGHGGNSIPSTAIQSTVLSDQRESQDSQKIGIGNVEHLEQREAKLVTSRDVESERIRQKENLISFVQIRTDFGQFLQEMRKKRIERTGISKEIDLWNDFIEYLYWASNLPPSTCYGSWFSLGKRLYFPLFEKDGFFDIYYPKTYRYRIKNDKDRSNLDPRKIWPSKDSFSQGVLSLKAKFQPPIQIRLYPKEWSKTQGGSFESL